MGNAYKILVGDSQGEDVSVLCTAVLYHTYWISWTTGLQLQET